MVVIGLIANPASGRDVRRLVAHASTVDNLEKSNIVKRMISVFDFLGIDRIVAMPETFGIIDRAISLLPQRPNIDIELLDIKVTGEWIDTYNAAELMKEGVDALVTIGGDGTNRVVAKTETEVPVMPISTGTNNVFPYMIEATIAALAVASVAMGYAEKSISTFQSKRLEVWVNNRLKDIALIDVAFTSHQFVASRAIWKPEQINEIFCDVCLPSNIGLSSVGGIFQEIGELDNGGYHVVLSQSAGLKIFAQILPGLLKELFISNHGYVENNKFVKVNSLPSIVALDGEREFELTEKDEVYVVIKRKGLKVIDYKKALSEGAKNGFFKEFKVKI